MATEMVATAVAVLGATAIPAAAAAATCMATTAPLSNGLGVAALGAVECRAGTAARAAAAGTME